MPTGATTKDVRDPTSKAKIPTVYTVYRSVILDSCSAFPPRQTREPPRNRPFTPHPANSNDLGRLPGPQTALLPGPPGPVARFFKKHALFRTFSPSVPTGKTCTFLVDFLGPSWSEKPRDYRRSEGRTRPGRPDGPRGGTHYCTPSAKMAPRSHKLAPRGPPPRARGP